MIHIMETFSWTYDEYLETPLWVIDLIIEKMKLDHKEEVKRNKK